MNNMARTIYRKKKINGIEYFHFRLRHENLRKPKDIYAKTVKELEAKIKNIKNDLDNNIKDNRIYFDKCYQDWLFNNHFMKLKLSTKNTYESLYRNHIKNSMLSDIRIKDLSVSDIQKYYKNLIKKGVTPHTVEQIHRLINPFIRYLYDNNMILKDFGRAIQLPKEDEKTKLKRMKKIHPFTKEEQKKFTLIIKDNQYEALYLTALYSGLRMGELLALTWDDISFKKGYIDVNKNIVEVAEVSEEGRDKIKIITQTPKTQGSIRKVVIPDLLIEVLKNHKEKQKNNIFRYTTRYKENNLVFSSRYGKHINQAQLRKNFRKVLESIKVYDKKFHDLRHTYATRLFELGENPKTVQKLLGHSNISITLDIYTYVLGEVEVQAISKLNNLFNEFNGVE